MMGSAKTGKTELLINVARICFIAFIVIFAIWYFASGRKFSVEAILSYTPENLFAATAFMLLLYAVKSVVFFLPIMALQIAVGLFFPTWAALIINIAGVAIELALAYWIGRKLGFNSADKLFKKFPKLHIIISGERSEWFISYILRAVNMLPIDLVSMYLGSVRLPFPVYMAGSMTGMLFGVLVSTFIGMSLTDPTSPMFIISCVLSCVISGGSILVYHFITKKKKNT